jgi:sugar/nucleoside kinase (ribokinase family)
MPIETACMCWCKRTAIVQLEELQQCLIGAALGSVLLRGITISNAPRLVQVYACSASPMERHEVVDTTGAGDAYIASLMYGLVNNKSVPDMMRLGSVVSAAKCTRIGARPGLPLRDQIDPSLL